MKAGPLAELERQESIEGTTHGIFGLNKRIVNGNDLNGTMLNANNIKERQCISGK